MATFVYPSAAELQEVGQVLAPQLVMNDPLFVAMDGVPPLFPIVEADDDLLVWEQLDDYIGLQNVRGLGAEFTRVARVGAKRFLMEPGEYGEFVDINERELKRRRHLGTFATAVNIDDLVMLGQRQLLHRRINRIRFIAWTLLSTGTFSVAHENGAVIHTDTFSVQTSTPGIAWATVATAIPLANLRTVQALGPPVGADFGSGARVYLNRATWNSLIGNTNAADLGGRFNVIAGPGQRARSIQNVNEVTLAEDLPSFVIYDKGFKNSAGTFTRFIPNNKAVLVGAREDGSRIGEYRMVRNASNPGMAPGPFTYVRDSMEHGDPPRRLDVYDGHSGGPVLYFPGSIVVLTV